MPFPPSNRDYIPTWKDELGPAYSLGAGAAAPSIAWGTLELSTLSTIAAGKVALLAFDIHKPVRPRGSATEYA